MAWFVWFAVFAAVAAVWVVVLALLARMLWRRAGALLGELGTARSKLKAAQRSVDRPPQDRSPYVGRHAAGRA